MTPTLPSIGDRESAQLEFKSIRIVDDAGRALSTIGREVVAMLNTTGGRIWIGVEEENEVAVRISGTTLTKINDLRSRLANYIVDSKKTQTLDKNSM
ncbi:MAG TPA: ATP-binding protein, partial [Planctomycetota bacterium]|nr:ATP-binding protein [Planctomycetota bacterium]